MHCYNWQVDIPADTDHQILKNIPADTDPTDPDEYFDFYRCFLIT